MITSLSVGLLPSPVSKIEAVKRHTRGRETKPRRYLYTNEICNNFSLPLPPSEVPLNFIQTVLTFWWHFCFRCNKYCLQLQFPLQSLPHPLFQWLSQVTLSQPLLYLCQHLKAFQFQQFVQPKAYSFLLGEHKMQWMIRQIRINLKMSVCLRIQYTRKLFMPTQQTVLFY